MHFLEYRVPSALEQLRQVLAIPFQKTDIRLVRHLTQAEMQAILDAPNPNTRDGVRDRAMLHLGFTGGLRVSELVGLKLSDVTFRAGYVDIHVMGKGGRSASLLSGKLLQAACERGFPFEATRAFLNCSSMRAPSPSPALASSTSLISTFPLPLTKALP